jgi:hypothetical protein
VILSFELVEALLANFQTQDLTFFTCENLAPVAMPIASTGQATAGHFLRGAQSRSPVEPASEIARRPDSRLRPF